MAGPIIEPAIKKTFTLKKKINIYFLAGFGLNNKWDGIFLDIIFEPEKTQFWVAIQLYAPWRFDFYAVSVHPIIWLGRHSVGGRGPQVHDEFVGLYSVSQTDAVSITTVTTECVLPVEPTSEHVSQTVLQ